MTDASHRPVDGAEPRSAPEPVADPRTPDPAGDVGFDPAAAIPEPSDGEALPPADERVPPAPAGGTTAAAAAEPDEQADDAEVSGGGATDRPDVGSAHGEPGPPSAAGGPDGDGAGDEPAGREGAGPEGAVVADEVVDVVGGAGIGGPDDPEVAPDPPVDPPSVAAAPSPPGTVVAVDDVAGGAGIGGTDDPAVVAAGEPSAGSAPVADAGTAEPPGGEPVPDGGTGPAVSSAAAAAALPPPPPELAEVPTDAGRIVTGRVREVAGDDVIVDLDDGRVGVINRRNLGLDAEPSTVLSPGDPVEGAVLARSDPQHRVVLSRTWALKKRAWEAVAAAATEGAVLTGKVVSVGQKGVVVDVGVRGFVPASHLEIGPVTDLQGYAGQELSLRILDVDTERERLVLSRRSLLLKEQRRSLHDVLSALQPGEVRRGKVTSLSEYGAFVDLGGVNGLVHLSELSWQRVRHPSEVVNVGDEVDVKVLDVKVKKRRVSLSIRQLTDDPLGSLVPGEIRSGPVTRLVDFGAFVDLSGVEGLVHLSELAEYRVSAPEEIVAPGEEVRVKVLSVDRRRRRVELSIRQAAEYGG